MSICPMKRINRLGSPNPFVEVLYYLILGGGKPFHFVVCLRPAFNHPIDENLVRQVIEQEKPAFCIYELSIEPRSTTDVPTLPILPAAIA
jgi:hypothetical protein